MYNYPGRDAGYAGPPPGTYGALPGVIQQQPQHASPPPGTGFGMPPGIMAAAAAAAPPGIAHMNFPPNFQPPPNLAHIDPTARVIHFTNPADRRDSYATGGQRRDQNDSNSARDLGSNRRGGLGYGRDGETRRDQDRPPQYAIPEPAREEIAKTIAIVNVPDDISDEWMNRILNVAGGLRRWIRCLGKDGKWLPLDAGLAEYEDADSLAAACDIFGPGLSLPRKKKNKSAGQQPNGVDKHDDHNTDKDTAEVNGTDEEETLPLELRVDPNSEAYIEEWHGRGGIQDAQRTQYRLDTANQELRNVLADLARSFDPSSDPAHQMDGQMRPKMAVTTDADTGEVIEIPFAVEDELSAVPPHMRETVAKEIAAFRDRSNLRDVERLRREEEFEKREKARKDNVPSGPRGPPSGPRGNQSGQPQREYPKNIIVIDGKPVVNARTLMPGYHSSDDDTDASGDEIQRRRDARVEAAAQKEYEILEAKWLKAEERRIKWQKKQAAADAEEEAREARAKADALAYYEKLWNMDEDEFLRTQEFHYDRSAWVKKRAAFRRKEEADDDRDRLEEAEELNLKQRKNDADLDLADDFLMRFDKERRDKRELDRERGPQGFSLSLGKAAQRVQDKAPQRRTVAEIENLLDNEEATTSVRRGPLKLDSSVPIAAAGADLTEEERAEAQRQLAQEIPSDKDGLWKWHVKWDSLDDSIVQERLRPFVQKKVMEVLGVQDDDMVQQVEENIRTRSSPDELVSGLENVLDEEAEPLVKKIWRMLVFYSESEHRGLAA